MKSKYTELVKQSIDEFWMVNHYPPTLRNLIDLVGKEISTSHMNKIVSALPNVRRSDNGRIIPKWVDTLFETKTIVV